MPRRISTNVSTQLNPFGVKWPSGGTEVTSVGEQVQDALFGKKKPTLLDSEEFAEASEIIKKLDSFRRKFATLAGDKEEDYRLQLADGTIAMIDQQGVIYFGVNFVMKFKDRLEVLIGALGHEVGHRPQRWAEYKTKQKLTPPELHKLCRYEETRADLFAGRAMAEVELSVEPMIQFLEDIEEGPSKEYYPASIRGDIIREGFQEQKARAQHRKALWPQLDLATSAKYHIGET